jgi:hypothetical protein
MANFCVALRITPTEYYKLTLVEYQALSKAFSSSQGNNTLEELFHG